MVAHDVGAVVDRDRDTPEALVGEKPDDLFQDRLAAHGQHGFRHRFGQRPEPRAKPARHQHDAGVVRRDPEEVLHRGKVDKMAGRVEHRHMLELAVADQPPGFGVRRAFGDGRRRDMHDLRHGPVKIDAAQDAAPNVAVGYGRHQFAVAIDHQRDLALGTVDGLDRLSERGVGGHGEGFQVRQFHGAHPVAKARPGPDAKRASGVRRSRPVRS